MGYDMIELTTDGAVATIKLDRPKALNALCGPMMAEMADALSKLAKDDSIGCVILTGSEKAFAAGADNLNIWTYIKTISSIIMKLLTVFGNLLSPQSQDMPWAGGAKLR